MCRKKKNCSCIFLFFGMGERAWHPEKCIALSDVYDWVNGTMRACGDAGLHLWLVGFRVRDKVRLGLVLGIGFVLGLVMVLELAHFTFCHTSSPQAHILPITV